MRIRWRISASAIFVTGLFIAALVVDRAQALVEPDPDGLIRLGTSVSADSVAVGQRFRVQHRFEYPDSLEFLENPIVDPGNCRVISATWKDLSSREISVRTADIVLLTIDLEAARFPEMIVDFKTPSGDTLRTFAGEVVVPVRTLTAEGSLPRPLKEQWTAPRGYWKWIAAGVVLALAAAALVYWWYRRRHRIIEARPEPKLPPDYVALCWS